MIPRWTAVALVLALSLGQAIAPPAMPADRAATEARNEIAVPAAVQRWLKPIEAASPDARKSVNGRDHVAPPPRVVALQPRHHVAIVETLISTSDHAPVTRHVAVARAPPRA